MVEGFLFTFDSTFEMWTFRIAAFVLAGFLLGGLALITRPEPEVVGHPKGLFVLFLAEMWERFSYYGMRALLIFYLIQHWAFSKAESSVIYGAYTALVYITPVIGGYLADRYLGQRKAVLFGAVLLTLGHFCMAFEGDGGQSDPMINVFWLALALIIVGSGFLKANISVIVGQLYSRTDIRRDPAYTIFYMGINVGAATASIICGYLGQTVGWEYGFGLAGFGMLIGLVFFVLGKPLLRGKGESPNPQKIAGGREFIFYGIGVALVGVCWLLIQYQQLVGWLLALFGVCLVVGIIFYTLFKLFGGRGAANAKVSQMATLGAGFVIFASFLLAAINGLSGDALLGVVNTPVGLNLPLLDPIILPLWGIFALAGVLGVLYIMVQQVVTIPFEERDRIIAALFLIFVSIIFWALFEQAGSSLNLFTDEFVDRQGVDASMFQSINAIYIILLAPVFAVIWQTMGRAGAEPSTPMKFGLGVVQVGLGFLVLVWGAENFSVTQMREVDGQMVEVALIPVVFIFLIYLLHTTGELCLSPVGLSAMNRLAPAHMASLIMGTWFFASATGNFAAGLIAAATGAEGVGEGSGREVVLDVYWTVGLVALGIGLVVMLVSPLIKRLMHLDTLEDDTVDDDLLGQSEIGEPQAAGIRPATRPAE
ncbi:MAG: oligopeptide:H+ symporter [Pseudomonadota bacterium]